MFAFLNTSQGEKVQSSYSIINETIPTSKLGYHTNNKYPVFPPLMQDGRSLISSWQPESKINDVILKQNNIQSNWQYRKFIRENANEILQYNFKEACNDTGYIIPPPIMGNRPSNPYYYKSIHDIHQPTGVENSDLKAIYLSREQLNSRKFAPSINQDQFIKMWET
jgi:hypothetical protein